MPLVDPLAGVDLGPLLSNTGADAVDVEVHIDAIGDGLLVAVFHDQVLVEETQRLFAGRGGKSDQEGIEVLEHLAPDVVDRPVTLVDEYHVEGLDGEARVVGDLNWLLTKCSDPRVEERPLLSLGWEFFFALEHREQTLDGRDDNSC